MLQDGSRLPLAALAIVTAALNLGAALIVWRTGNLPFQGRGTRALDIGWAFALNIMATAVLSAGSFLISGADVFWQYMLGTVVVWTTLKGIRLGLAVAGIAAILEFLLILLNSSSLTGAGIVQVVTRTGWLLVAVVVPWSIVTFATRGAEEAVRIGMVKGVSAAKERILLDLHDIILQIFAQILSISRSAALERPARVGTINELALRSIPTMRQRLRGTQFVHESLCLVLQDLKEEYATVGFAVAIPDHIPPHRLAPAQLEALSAAIREALNNSWRYSGVQAAEVRCPSLTANDGFTVEVVDEGQGFAIAEVNRGYGLVNSIMRRMADVGGSSEIESGFGAGSCIRLTVPSLPVPDQRNSGAVDASAKWFWDRLLNKLRVRLSGVMRRWSVIDWDRRIPDGEGAGELQRASQDWVAMPALIYRCLITPLSVTLAIATLSIEVPATILSALWFVQVFSILLLAYCWAGRLNGYFRWRSLVAEVASAVLLNLWSATIVPTGTIFSPGSQFVWGYMYCVILLWTALRGALVGWFLILVGVGCQVGMGLLNGVVWTLGTAGQSVAQVLKLIACLAIAWMVTRLSRKGVALAAQEAELAGVIAARASELREVDDGAIEVLRGISEICSGSESDSSKLQQIRGAALLEVDRLRRFLRSEQEFSAPMLDDVVASFRGLGLRIEFVTEGDLRKLPHELFEAARPALSSALRDVLSLTDEGHVVVSCRSDGPEVLEVSVRDHGSRQRQGQCNSSTIEGGVETSVHVSEGIDGGTRVRIRACILVSRRDTR